MFVLQNTSSVDAKAASGDRVAVAALEADRPHSDVFRFGADKPLALDAGVALSPFAVARPVRTTADSTQAPPLPHFPTRRGRGAPGLSALACLTARAQATVVHCLPHGTHARPDPVSSRPPFSSLVTRPARSAHGVLWSHASDSDAAH